MRNQVEAKSEVSERIVRGLKFRRMNSESAKSTQFEVRSTVQFQRIESPVDRIQNQQVRNLFQ